MWKKLRSEIYQSHSKNPEKRRKYKGKLNQDFKIIEWAVVPDQGKWLRIRPSQTLLVAEYFLAGFATEVPVFLSNDVPPAYECDTCVPESQPVSCFRDHTRCFDLFCCSDQHSLMSW